MRMASLERCSKVLKQHVNRVEGENQLMHNFQENVSTLFMQGKVFCEGSKTGLLQKNLKILFGDVSAHFQGWKGKILVTSKLKSRLI